ncbi:unnamed protein product [Cuscuta campestris]|uniref:Uncharacterized protein n=1 Tax=Cuscuta campestris TaxID=132261 RepID=A0A484NN90_9ASTE|nr:unnamed protein product [Cuscuta campestris]
MSSSDSQNVSGQSYGSGSQPSFSSESSSPPVTPLIRRPSHQSNSQAREIIAQDPVPLNQLPGRFNPKVLSWEQWEERLGSLGFLALDVRPVFKESSRVTKKVLAEVRTILPPGYKVLSTTTWPNIIEPHQGTRLGFHIASLEGGIIFPLRPLLVEICNKFKILPDQLTPNAHRVHPEPTPELEDACEKLLKGDLVTGKPYAYGGWVYRLPNPDGGESATHDAEDDRANSPDGHAEASSPRPDMNFNRMTTIIEDDDDDVQVLHSNRSPNRNLPSPSQNIGVERASTARCFSFDDLIRDKQVGVLSEEIGQSLIEPTNQVSQLNLLLDSAKSEINDLVERERKLKVELRAERALLEEERARSARWEEEGKRKVAELEEALAQAEETARSKEEAFPDDAAIWAACHHTEVARSILTNPEDTMDFFKVMYKEPEGKRMITDVGSYGFQCGQKEERSLLYARLQRKDPSFDPAKLT